MVNELVFRAVNAIEDGFSGFPSQHLGFQLSKSQSTSLSNDEARQDALDELKQVEVDNGIVQLETLLNATVDKDFDKFEIYTLRNILAVGHDEENLADWVRLDHYQGVDAVRAEEVPRPEDVQLQRRKLHETAKLNILLKAEEAKNAAILSQLSSLIGDARTTDDKAPLAFSFLKSSPEARQSQHLSQDTQYALNQLPALQKLLAQLREAMKTLPSTRRLRFEDEDSLEARRRRYLHTQSLRALEKRGIDVDNSAGAAAAAVGRKVGRDEVEGIETVIQALNAGGETQRQHSRDRSVDS